MNTLKEFLDYTAERFPECEAYVWEENGTIVSRTFPEFRDDAARMARGMRERFGTRRKIALIGVMSYPWIRAYYGIMNSDNISVPLDAKLSLPELEERLRFADVSAVFVSDALGGLREGILRACGKDMTVMSLESAAAEISAADAGDSGPVDPDALASLMFTSGTSGDGLKAAMITHRAILADVTGPVPLCVPGDRLLSVLPIHHCFEIFVGQMKYLYLGATICVNDSMANLVPNLTRFGITIVAAVPALANMVAALIAQGLKTRSIAEIRQALGGKLRRITIGGASANKEVIDTLAMAGITIFVGYGLTETAGGCLANCDASVRPREAGAPYVEGMEMKLEDGELCLRGPMIMQGYYKAPELTAKVIDRDGWFHTGDLAEITDENYVIILGRKDNMIKTPNGEKVYPENWENRLLTIPGVAAAMVAEVRGHLTALLFLKQDTPEIRRAVEETIGRINEGLPNYEKIPDVRFREKPFPMTTSLKIRRGEVMRELEAASRDGAAFAAPENETQKRILEQVLKVLPGGGPVGIDDNLFDHGMDSLLAINLAILLECGPDAVYAYRTVRQLAAYKDAEGGKPAPENGTGAKREDINRFIGVTPQAAPGLGDTVLLTGAGGYLGAHLLSELAKNGRKAVCLVRSPERFGRACEYYGVPFGDLNAEILTGDVTKDRLGLGDEAYAALAERVDAVVHAAALVSHVGSGGESVRVNAGGTRQIVRFCADAGAKLFHISSYAVSGFGTEKTLTEDVLDIGQTIDGNPYILSKYMAEEIVLQARGDGVPSTVFRLGNLTARSTDGLFQMNAESSGMAAQMNAVRRLGMFPESMRGVPYDTTPVDKAARAVVLLAEKHGAGHIWHIMNPDVRFLSGLPGVRAVDDAAFEAALAENSADRDVAIASVYYRMNRQGFNTRFSSEKTRKELAELGFSWN